MHAPEIREAARRAGRLLWLPLVIFATGLTATHYLQANIRESKRQAVAAEFAFRANQVAAGIDARLRNHEQMLSGAAGLFDAMPAVDRAGFAAWVARLALAQRYPGVQGVGFARWVPADELARHVAAVRATGFADYTVHPAGKRDGYGSIVHLEPVDWRNRRAFGYDMYSEAVRRLAMERARDTGRAAISGKVKLVQETDVDVQPGFLMYLPVCHRGKPCTTSAQRRANLLGWVYAPFRMRDLMQGILGRSFGETGIALGLTIHDGEEPGNENLLFDSGAAGSASAVFREVKTIAPFGQPWTLTIHSLPPFEARLHSERADLVTWAGWLASLLLAIAAGLLASTRARALKIAADMTKALQQSESLFRSVFENVQVGVVQVSPTGILLRANEAFCRFIGYSSDEVQNGQLPFQQITAPEDVVCDNANVERLLDGQAERYHLEKRYLRKDGVIVWGDLTSILIRNPAGEPLYFISAVQDITARKQIENELTQYRDHLERLIDERTTALHEAEIKYRTVADFASDWETWIDPAGRLVYCSPSCERISGYPAARFLADDSLFLDIVHADDRARVREHLHLHERADPFEILRFRIVHADGRIVWIEHACQQVTDGGTVNLGRRAANRDITLRVEAEEALVRARNAAEAANRAKSAFLANMSHELRTPLNAVLGFSELMGHDADITPRQRENLDIISRSGQHLLSMINEVLDLSKIEAGRIDIIVEPFDLHALLDDIAVMFRVRTDAKGLRFLFECDPALPRHVRADARKLRQILINLLGNAVKFTATGGIALRVAPKACPQGLHLLFEVEDSGVGIAAADLPGIFDPFVQAAAGVAQHEGSGLGLAISRKLAQLMGGDIAVTSEPGQGSLFRLELPAAVGEPPTAIDTASGTRTLAPGQPEWKILVVDDKLENRLLLCQLLETAGFTMAEAEDGASALALFASWQPRLIWMDMRMPEMDGYETTRRLRQLPGGDRVRILAVTASAFAEQRDIILAAGCDDVIHKPYRTDEILDAMASHLGVRYVTTNAAPAGTPAAPRKPDLQRLPAAVISELLAAADLLDASATRAAIDRARAIDPAAADALDAIANTYRFEEIAAVCREIA